MGQIVNARKLQARTGTGTACHSPRRDAPPGRIAFQRSVILRSSGETRKFVERPEKPACGGWDLPYLRRSHSPDRQPPIALDPADPGGCR